MSDAVKRALHTAWQTFFSALVVGLAGVKDLSGAKVVVVSAVMAAAGTFLSLVKSAFLASNLAAYIKAKFQLKQL